MAAARANHDVGDLDKKVLKGIEMACVAIMDGQYHDQFLVDLYQGGAGTSTNMNANEVIANVALEMMGHQKGEYDIVEPHDDLNMSQSTNDFYPTALKVAMVRLLSDRPEGGDGGLQRTDPGGGQTIGQVLQGEGQGVRRYPENGTY